MFVADSSITSDGFVRIDTKCGISVGLSMCCAGCYQVYTLTPCCDAATKVLADNDGNPVWVCKECYKPMPYAFGEGTMVEQLRIAGCETPYECAQYVLDIVDWVISSGYGR